MKYAQSKKKKKEKNLEWRSLKKKILRTVWYSVFIKDYVDIKDKYCTLMQLESLEF